MTIVLRKKGYEDKSVVWSFEEDQKKQRYSINETLIKETRSRRKAREAREVAAKNSTSSTKSTTKSSGKSTTKSSGKNTLIAPNIGTPTKPTRPKKTGNDLVAPDL